MTQISTRLSVAQPADPVVHPAWVKRLAGTVMVLSRAEFDLAVTEERDRIRAGGSGIYPDGQPFQIVGEVGVRRWFLAAGGTNEENAAASHARRCEIRPGLLVSLLTDANVATSAVALPSGGAEGDCAVNYVDNLYWVRTNIGWPPAGGSVFPGGGFTQTVNSISSLQAVPLELRASASTDGPTPGRVVVRAKPSTFTQASPLVRGDGGRVVIEAQDGADPAVRGRVEIKAGTSGDDSGFSSAFGDQAALNLDPSGSGISSPGGELFITPDGLALNAEALGFFGGPPTTQPVGVPVTAAGIHAALVALNLIAP